MERNGWEIFLDSWARPGGSVFMLFLALLLFVPATAFIMIKWGPATPVAISMNSITSGIAGAFALALNPGNAGSGRRTSDQNGNVPTPNGNTPAQGA